MSDYYESQKSLYEYLLFHYGNVADTIQFDICPREATDFPKRCADLCVEFTEKFAEVQLRKCTNIDCHCTNLSFFTLKQHVWIASFVSVQGNKWSRAADIGCAVGRSTFEMTQQFQEVVGIDYSQAFVDTCNKLKHDCGMDYKAVLEGDVCQEGLRVTFNPAWVSNCESTLQPLFFK